MTTPPAVTTAIAVLRAEMRAVGDEPQYVYLAADVYALLVAELEADGMEPGSTDIHVLGMPVRVLDAMTPGNIHLSAERFQ